MLWSGVFAEDRAVGGAAHTVAHTVQIGRADAHAHVNTRDAYVGFEQDKVRSTCEINDDNDIGTCRSN